MKKEDKIYCILVGITGIALLAALSYGPIAIHLLNRDLNKRGVITYGIIYETNNNITKYGNLKDTLTYRYYFEANNIRYRGSFSAHWKLHYHLDDTIKLRYDPLNPSRNQAIIEKTK